MQLISLSIIMLIMVIRALCI